MMARKRSKPVSFDVMVKFFLKQYGIPTRKDFDRLVDRMERLERAVRAANPKAGGAAARPRKQPSATEKVLSLIGNHDEGVGIADIQAKTRLEEKKLRNIIYRLHKTGRIQRRRRGIYTAAP
jgi:hypothetical protein